MAKCRMLKISPKRNLGVPKSSLRDPILALRKSSKIRTRHYQNIHSLDTPKMSYFGLLSKLFELSVIDKFDILEVPDCKPNPESSIRGISQHPSTYILLNMNISYNPKPSIVFDYTFKLYYIKLYYNSFYRIFN